MRFLTSLPLFLIPLLSWAQSPSSDSLDIIHTAIHLNVTDFDGQTISGYASIQAEATSDITGVYFDLQGLDVDSVIVGAEYPDFVLEDNMLAIAYPMEAGETVTFQIYYGGSPDKDDLWGGWYWSGEQAFQLGVGFVDDPHNYGRIWFPCFDDFIERSTFSFHITTLDTHKAFCGGILTDSVINGDGTTTWNWMLEQPIPSYLASVAVAEYTTIEWWHEGVEENILIQLGVKEDDADNMLASFIHLGDAINAFETGYGPYRWDRVGYVAVPFGGGAMEHACNIAYPNFGIDGGTTWETLMAHELAHSWWGNLVTCSAADEMWINEGWASFSEYLFLEHVYGRDTYMETVNNDHLNVIRYGYAFDGNVYEPLAGVTHDNTYGYTTYTRGAVTVHNMRGYMGDELFFECISSFLDEHAFSPVSSEAFSEYLSTCSGLNMAAFFDGWIFNAGTPSFELQNYPVVNEDGLLEFCIEQKLNHAEDFFEDIPLEISLVNDRGETRYSTGILMTGELGTFSIAIPDTVNNDFRHVIIDRYNLIADATTSDELWLTETGEYDLDRAQIEIDVYALESDTDWIRIEHYWVAADGKQVPETGVHLHSQRYWRVMGGYNGEQISAVISFNGTQNTSGGYLDNEFINNSDDSLLLFYRPDPQQEWELFAHYELDPWGNKNDKRGVFELSQLPEGEYAIGILDHSLPTASADQNDCIFTSVHNLDILPEWDIHPNPAQGYLWLDTSLQLLDTSFALNDIKGQLIQAGKLDDGSRIDISGLAEGTYLVSLFDDSQRPMGTRKVVIIR